MLVPIPYLLYQWSAIPKTRVRALIQAGSGETVNLTLLFSHERVLQHLAAQEIRATLRHARTSEEKYCLISKVGLTLVKRIIEVHGGQIWVESELERCNFFFHPTKYASKRVGLYQGVNMCGRFTLTVNPAETQEALRETDFIFNQTVGINIARCLPPQGSCGPPVSHVVQENSENFESMWKNV